MSWNKSKDIFYLACGHGRSLDGSWDSGCVYGKYTEAALMLKITSYAVKILKHSGVKVLTDPKNDKNMKACVAEANKKYPACKYYMSIHCDFKDASPGVAPLYVSSSGKKMAEKIGKSVAKQMGMKWKGAFKRSNLYELNATKMTAVIFETGCISKDLKYLKAYKKYGKALAKAICAFIGVKFQYHSNQYIFRAALDKTFKEMKALGFKYEASYTKCSLTWAGAKKKRKSNCSLFVCYGLQRAKFLNKGEYFWLNGDNIVCRGGLTLAELKKKFTITHPHKSPKNASLKKGDIVGYKNSPHTMVFAGWNKKGEPTWYSVSTGDLKAKKEPRVKPSYNNKTIYTKMRLK